MKEGRRKSPSNDLLLWWAESNTLSTLLKCHWKSTDFPQASILPLHHAQPPLFPAMRALMILNSAHAALFSSFSLKNKSEVGILAGVYPCPVLIS